MLPDENEEISLLGARQPGAGLRAEVLMGQPGRSAESGRLLGRRRRRWWFELSRMSMLVCDNIDSDEDGNKDRLCTRVSESASMYL
jgi:hypothetical protein